MSPEDYDDDDFKIKGREKKLEKKKNMMRVNGRALKTLILPLIGEKSKPKRKSDFKMHRVTDRLTKTYTFDY